MCQNNENQTHTKIKGLSKRRFNLKYFSSCFRKIKSINADWVGDSDDKPRPVQKPPPSDSPIHWKQKDEMKISNTILNYPLVHTMIWQDWMSLSHVCSFWRIRQDLETN